MYSDLAYSHSAGPGLAPPGAIRRVLLRPAVAFCLLLAFCHSADAATRTHRRAAPRHIIVNPGPAFAPAYVSPNGTRVFRDDSAPGGFRTDHDPPVSYNDPSKYGGN